MAIAHIQDTSVAYASGFTLTTSAIGATNLVVVGAYMSAGSSSPVISGWSGVTGATWHQVGSAYNPTGHEILDIWYATGATGGGTSITASFSTSPLVGGAFLIEASGAATTSPLDTSGNNTGSSSTSSSLSLTPGATGDLFFSVGVSQDQAFSGTPTGPWSIVGTTQVSGYSGSMYYIASNSSAQSGSWGLGGSSTWYTRAACFTPPVLPPSSVPPWKLGYVQL